MIGSDYEAHNHNFDPLVPYLGVRTYYYDILANLSTGDRHAVQRAYAYIHHILALLLFLATLRHNQSATMQ